jgi:hypothetical protein
MLTQALRGLLARERQKSTTKGVLIFAVSSSLYLMTLVGIEVSTSFVQTILAVFLNGAFIGLLFIIGHDACHGSLVKSRWLNRLLGTWPFFLHTLPLVRGISATIDSTIVGPISAEKTTSGVPIHQKSIDVCRHHSGSSNDFTVQLSASPFMGLLKYGGST